MGKSCVLGLDGGGTKTVCLVADEDGRILGRGVGGPSNYLSVGLYTARTSLKEAIFGALENAGLRGQDVAVICAGMAGVARRVDREVMCRALAELLPGPRVILETDAFVALAGATNLCPGVIVISGTGSVAFGLNSSGVRSRAGGWGYLLGDEGSGYDIARRGLICALREFDGRGPKTLISEMIAKELYLRTTEDLIPLLYSAPATPGKIASLYPIILEAADAGDEAALSLISQASAALMEMVSAVVDRLGMRGERFPLATSGGVFTARAVQELFKALAGEQFPEAELIRPRRSSEEGAVFVAVSVLAGRGTFSEC